MLKSRRSRELLLKYSGYTRDRKCIKNPKALSAAELKRLQALLKKEGALPLAELISHLSSESHQNLAPQPYQELLYELSLNTPVCGMLQVAGSKEAIEVVQLIASGTDICNVKYHQELKLLQDTTPILASLLLKLPFSEAIPDDVCTLISQLCDLVLAPFQPRSQTFPSPPADSELTYFPNLSMVCGVPVYSADQSSHRQKQEDQDACRKYSSKFKPPHAHSRYFYHILSARSLLWFRSNEDPPPPPPPPSLVSRPHPLQGKGSGDSWNVFLVFASSAVVFSRKPIRL